MKYNTAPVKFIVVDNGSTKPGVVGELDSRLSALFPTSYRRVSEGEPCSDMLSEMTFLVSPDNSGYASGNNKGLQLAYADDEIDRVMILNSDILFVEDIIPSLIAEADKLPDCGIISPILYKKGLKEIDYNCARQEVSSWEIIKENFATPLKWALKLGSKRLGKRYMLANMSDCPSIMPIGLPSGSCMLMKKDVMHRIGGFDDATFLYYEENILAKKLARLGLRSYIDTDMRCIHLGATTTKHSPSKKIVMAGLHSQKYFIRKYSGVSPMLMPLYWLSYAGVVATIDVKSLIKGK